MVELAVDDAASPESILALAERLAEVTFKVDRRYGSVPIRAMKEDAERLVAARQRAVIVRGMVDGDKVSALESQPQVLKVWADAEIEPFRSPRIARRRKHPRKPAKPPKLKKLKKTPPDCSGGNAPLGDMADVVTALGVDKIWSLGYKGAGIVVGMVDAGICAKNCPNPHPACTVEIDRVIDGWPTNDWGTTADEWEGHGNMTAFDVLGIAPEAQLYDIRIVNVNSGNPATDFKAWVSDAVTGYDWAIQRHQADGTPQILNNSWGLYKKSSDLQYATNPQSPFARQVEGALNEGIMVVFAAGNCGEACPYPKCGTASVGADKSILGPNGHPDVMTVGAINLNKQWVGYSSQGKAVLPPNAAKPDFCTFTQFTGYYPGLDQNYASDCGTSAAAAVVAGVVALLKQYRDGLTQAQAKTALMTTAKDLLPAGPDPKTGAGMIRAKKAFDSI